MFVWDPTDVLTCLEVEPEVDDYAISYRYTVARDGLRLALEIHAYDGDTRFDLYRDGVDEPVFSLRLIGCPGVRYLRDAAGERLEFAHARCSGTRFDPACAMLCGVRLAVQPSIRIEVF